MKLKNLKTKSIAILSIGIIVGLYIITKATVASFTHDESFTYLHYPHSSFMDILSFRDWYLNNHILNSLSMKYSEMLFGNSEIALRLPNLAALLVYLVYSYRLFQQKNWILSFSIFTILATNILLIDLFGMARGYGLSFGFMMMSLFHFLAYIKKPKKIDLYGFHIAALLAILSHFTLLTFYISLMVIFNLVMFVQAKLSVDQKFHLFKTNKQHFFPLLVNLVILYEPVRRVIQYANMGIGGKDGFYTDTVSSFIYHISNDTYLSGWVKIVFQIIVTLMILAPFFITVWNIIKKNETFLQQHKGLIITNLLLLSISFIIIMNHYIIGSDYPVGRFTIFIIPLFWVQIGYFIGFLFSSAYKTSAIVFITSIALVSCISFITKANLKSYGEWAYDSETKNMIQDMVTYHKMNNHESKKIRMGSHWLFEPTINYYINTKEINWLTPTNRNTIHANDHYIYTFEDSLQSMGSFKYEIIKKYESTNTILIRNKTAFKRN